ncbi:MAG: alpha/beta hydrolase family protein [Rectinema subterraneum]|uniref:alpha/beta hydrolase family protein n=1 Tax=Rectinema subterraneum TaxID=2653714 RepID=UPI003C7DC684
MKRLVVLVLGMLAAVTVFAQSAVDTSYPIGSVIGDPLPSAPALAPRGPFAVGVTTLEMVNPNQVDILASIAQKANIVSDRHLKVEVWYPALVNPGQVQITQYTEFLGRADQPGTLIPFKFTGRAVRDATPDTSQNPYPLVVISHGYPGSRYMLSYLGENLASKGYVVAAIGHTDSTYEDVGNFVSTLVNRSFDQRFVISEMLRLSASDSMWKNFCDPSKIGLVGYSMGGYGALRSMGAGCNDMVKAYAGDFAAPILASPTDAGDPRIKATVLFAPWGGTLGTNPTGLWDQNSLAKITIPTLWIAGSQDDVAGYKGIVNLFNASVNSKRYLLTYDNALHNVAPNPAPPEAVTLAQYYRWADPVWDSRRVNNINEHFVTAFFDLYLKGDTNAGAYLNVPVENSNDGVYALNKDGTKAPNFSYWPGFPPRTALGLHLRVVTP